MPENDKKWLEQELESSLRRVAAPSELWDRIQGPERSHSHVRTRFMAWAAVPAVMFVTLWGSHSPNSPALPIRSADPAEVRALVKTNPSLSDGKIPMLVPAGSTEPQSLKACALCHVGG